MTRRPPNTATHLTALTTNLFTTPSSLRRALAKREFTIDTGKEQIPVEGHAHYNVAVKYLMKRRRSLIMTKDAAKVERLFSEVPTKISIIGANVTKTYKVSWERVSTGEFAGARFTFTLDET